MISIITNMTNEPKKKKYVNLCGDCGNRLGRYAVGSSDWKEKKCSGCGEKKTVTRASDFGL